MKNILLKRILIGIIASILSVSMLTGCGEEQSIVLTYESMPNEFVVEIPIYENTIYSLEAKDSDYATEASDFLIDESGNVIKKNVYSSDESSYSYVMEYDANNMPSKTTIYDEAGNIFSVYEYKYDAYGNVVYSTFDFDGSIDEFIYEYEYAEDGIVIGMKSYYLYDWTTSYTVDYSNYVYDNNGNISAYTTLDSRDNALVVTEFSYDGAGRKVKEKTSGILYKYSYDSNGYVTLVESDSSTQKYIYDIIGFEERLSSDLGMIKNTSEWKSVVNLSIPSPVTCMDFVTAIASDEKENVYKYDIPEDNPQELFRIYQGLIGSVDGCKVLPVDGTVYVLKDGIAQVTLSISADNTYGYILVVEPLIKKKSQKSEDVLLSEKTKLIAN